MSRRPLPAVELIDGLVVRLLGDVDAGTQVLWIHGLGESGLCFERVAADPRLAGWRHLIPDLTGYGRTPWPPEATSLEDHARRLSRWLDSLAPDPVVVVGHSMGGVIGQMLCESLTDSRRAPLGFVNVEGNVSPGDCAYSSRIDAMGLDQFLDHGFHEIARQVFERAVDDEAHRTYYASLRSADPRTLHLNSIELVSISEREELAARFAALATPKVYLGGAGVGGVCPGSIELLRGVGEEPVLIPDAGHWPFVDQPEPFVRQLLSFLDSVGAD